MDKTDREIVRLLQIDGRMSHEQISKEIHLSRPAVHDRIRRMEAAGVIRGYTVQVDWDALGLPLGAFIFVRVAGICMPVAEKIVRLGGEDAVVLECHRVAGDWCLLVSTRSASTTALQQLHDELRAIPSVQNTMTVVALSVVQLETACAIAPPQTPEVLTRTRGK